jgi:hypothetical protein
MSATNLAYKLNLNNTFTSIANLPTVTFDACTGSSLKYNNLLCSVGGTNGSTQLNQTSTYTPDSWTAQPNLITRTQAAAASMNFSFVHVFSGLGTGGMINSLQRFNGSWSTSTVIPINVLCGNSCNNSNKIFVTHGSTSTAGVAIDIVQSLNSAQAYTTEASSGLAAQFGIGARINASIIKAAGSTNASDIPSAATSNSRQYNGVTWSTVSSYPVLVSRLGSISKVINVLGVAGTNTSDVRTTSNFQYNSVAWSSAGSIGISNRRMSGHGAS